MAALLRRRTLAVLGNLSPVVAFAEECSKVAPNLELYAYGRGYHGSKSFPVRPADFAEISSLVPEIEQYHHSPKGIERELAAIVNMFQVTPVPQTPLNCELRERALAFMPAPPIREPAGSYDLVLHPLVFLDAAMSENRQANPGYPFNLRFNNKGEVLDEFLPELYAICALRFLAYDYLSLSQAKQPLRSLLQLPYAVLLKTELTKKAHARIILMQSIADAVCSRILLTTAADSNKSFCLRGYSAIGIGAEIEHANILCGRFDGRRNASLDVPTFDATVSLFSRNLHYVHLLSRYDRTSPLFRRRLRMHFMSVAHAPIIISDGTIFRNVVNGPTKTGDYWTSHGNTFDQANRLIAAGLRVHDLYGDNPNFADVVAAGDDGVLPHHPKFEDVCAELHFPIRDYEVQVSDLTFCSHTFKMGQMPIGKRIYKAFSSVIHEEEPDAEIYLAFYKSFVGHPDFDRLAPLLLRFRPSIKFFKNLPKEA